MLRPHLVQSALHSLPKANFAVKQVLKKAGQLTERVFVAYYALILRSLTVLEGLALSADRNYKLLGKAYPYMAKRLLTDPSPELRCCA